MINLNLCNKLIRCDVLESTNTYAVDLVKSERSENGTVILAEYQTKGRGQLDNSWESDKGKNLTFTIVYYPDNFEASQQFFLSMALSTGIYEFLNTEIQDVKIKWPNDIYVGNRKIAGILIENFVKGNKITGSLLGVGLNVNQEVFPDYIYKPTSLRLEKKLEYNRELVLINLLQSIENKLLLLNSGNLQTVKEDYESQMYLRKQWSNFMVGDSVLTAMITGVNEQGQLVLIKEDSSLVVFNFKEIVFPSH